MHVSPRIVLSLEVGVGSLDSGEQGKQHQPQMIELKADSADNMALKHY